MKKRINIGRLLFAGFLTVLVVVILNIKSIDKITLTDFIVVFIVLLVYGYKDFQAYLDFKTSIKNGVNSLNNGSIWGIDYMIISRNPENANQIIVRNDLMWIENAKKQNENKDRLLTMLISDFEIVAKSRQLRNYLKDKTVIFNLYSYGLKDEELLKTEEKNYGS
ncbi:MAG: hypothetical protein NTY07_11605 [Bacteroidia bacterium]|nr:hypothetical protein [Bacteroidia bacterium]